MTHITSVENTLLQRKQSIITFTIKKYRSRKYYIIYCSLPLTRQTATIKTNAMMYNLPVMYKNRKVARYIKKSYVILLKGTVSKDCKRIN